MLKRGNAAFAIGITKSPRLRIQATALFLVTVMAMILAMGVALITMRWMEMVVVMGMAILKMMVTKFHEDEDGIYTCCSRPTHNRGDGTNNSTDFSV